MRLRQTYQPNCLSVSPPQRQQRVVHSFGKDLKTPDSIKPLSALTNLRLFLYKTKQRLDYKQASQFSRNDPLIKEQPSFLFNKLQTDPGNQIKFQAFLDGELKPEEYLTLQNYRRLYNITKNDNGSFEELNDDQGYQTIRESPLKKLKERIIHRHNLNKRKRVSEISSQIDSSKCNTPGVLIAQQLKKVIIRKHMNKINEELTAEKTLKSLKLVQSADFAVTQLQQAFEQDKNEQTYIKKKVNSTKQMKIIAQRSQIEKSQDNQESKLQLSKQIINQANKTFYEEQTKERNKQILKQSKQLKFSNAKMKQMFALQESIPTNRKCVTDRSISQISKQKQQKLHYMGENNLDERDYSAESSLCSMFEKKVNYLYNQSILLKKNMITKDSIIKRIKHMQSFNQVVEEAVQTNNQKLYRI